MVAFTVPLIERAAGYGNRTAIIAQEGTFTYDDLLEVSERLALGLLEDKRDHGTPAARTP